MPETISKAVNDNKLQELAKQIKECKWLIEYHTEQAETARLKLEAFQSLYARLESENSVERIGLSPGGISKSCR